MEKYYKRSINEVQEELSVNANKGLSSDEVAKRLAQYGKNKLTAKQKKSLLVLFIEQLKSFMVLILLIAAAVSGVVGVMHNEGLLDTYIILGILIVNAIIKDNTVL